MILGLTGGIGCGKSTAAGFFAQEGFRLIDADAIVKTEVLTDTAVLARIQERFGKDFVVEGRVDRAKLAARVFSDREALDWLEALTHPEVRRRWQARIAEAPSEPWVVEVPLLHEKELNKLFDFVVCVACSRPLQLSRLEKRGLPRDQAERRISQQFSLERKIELSDFVLSNDGSPEFLRRQIADLAAQLLRDRPTQSPVQ